VQKDFCNNIGTKRTFQDHYYVSALGGKPAVLEALIENNSGPPKDLPAPLWQAETVEPGVTPQALEVRTEIDKWVPPIQAASVVGN
jgi:hypothetical protein